MTTDAQVHLNLGSLAQQIQIEMDLDQINPADWTYTQRTEYVHALAQGITQYPDSFDAQTLGAARVIASKDYGELSPDNLWLDPQYGAEFDGYFADNALAIGDDFATLGQGVSHLVNGVGRLLSNAGDAAGNTGSALTWALPVAAVLLLVMFAQSTDEKVSNYKWLK